ncbi:hypothetical protein L1987_38046 [Smallanthus sonchifolius]|uniref:Uncharacterized protein n=1 Tax=Smallanthus sonchifolius TaxID=185202 RepID=A0ACB9HI48_9ASTR|nr:hypothetical protein L1987_38046 [Smallanthus sonchifolius]
MEPPSHELDFEVKDDDVFGADLISVVTASAGSCPKIHDPELKERLLRAGGYFALLPKDDAEVEIAFWKF